MGQSSDTVPATVVDATEILRTVVGSGVHGIAIEGTDDHDEMGVFVEPPDRVVGLAGTLDHHLFRTQPEGHRSGPGDVDLIRYSLRKYVRLAIRGNPTVLVPLFAQGDDVLICSRLGQELRDLAPLIVSQQAGHRFLGYMHNQRERMEGRGKQNRVPNRPELVERYGFDTKYASHALRLAIQGWELMTTGRLELPMRAYWREQVRDVKTGRVGRGEVLQTIQHYEERLQALLASGECAIRPEPDRVAVSRWLVGARSGSCSGAGRGRSLAGDLATVCIGGGVGRHLPR